MRDLVYRRIQLSSLEHAQLRAAVERDASAFLDRLNRFIEIEEIEQPWFRQHRILDVQSNVPFPARRVHVVASATEMRVLTAHIENLQGTAANDPSRELVDDEDAANFAFYGDFWTQNYPLGEMRLASFAEIPFHSELDESARQTVDRLESQFADKIAPEQRTRTSEGWVFHFWLLAMGALIQRRLVVTQNGKLLRADTVHATELPVPFGNYWGRVNGRSVPIG